MLARKIARAAAALEMVERWRAEIGEDPKGKNEYFVDHMSPTLDVAAGHLQRTIYDHALRLPTVKLNLLRLGEDGVAPNWEQVQDLASKDAADDKTRRTE